MATLFRYFKIGRCLGNSTTYKEPIRTVNVKRGKSGGLDIQVAGLFAKVGKWLAVREFEQLDVRNNASNFSARSSSVSE